MKHLFAVFILMALIAFVAYNDEVITKPDGQKILLKDDHTWKVLEASPAEPITLTLKKNSKTTEVTGRLEKYRLFLDESQYHVKLSDPGNNADAKDLQLVSNDNTIFGMTVYESDTFDLDLMPDIVISNAKNAGAEVVLQSVQPAEVNGTNGKLLQYKVSLKNLNFIFLTFVYSGPLGTLQFTGYTYESIFGKTKEKLLSLLSGLVMGNAGGLLSESETGDQKVVLNVLNYADSTGPGYAAEQEIWDRVRSDLKSVATIQMEELFNEPFHQRIREQIASRHLSDVLYLWPSGRSAPLHQKNLLKDLTPLLGKEFLSHFSRLSIDPHLQIGGYLGELPIGVTSTHVLYANKALLEANGLRVATTYDELVAQVPKLKAKGIATVLMANKDDWVMQSCLFSALAGRIAGDAFFDSVMTGKAKFTDKPFVDSLAFVQRLYRDGVLAKTTLTTGYGDLPRMFANGEAAYMIDGDWRVGAFLTDPTRNSALIPPARQDNFLLTVFPKIPGEKAGAPETSIIVGTGFGIDASIKPGTDKEKAAVELIKELNSPEIQMKRLQAGMAFPSRTDVTSELLEPLARSRAQFYGKFEKGSYVLDSVLDPTVITALNTGLRDIGLGKSTPQEVAQKVQQAYDILKK